MLSTPSRSDSAASTICSAPANRSPLTSSGCAQRLAQELHQRRAVAVSDIEPQPLAAALHRGEQRAARQQDRVIACAPYELLDRCGPRHPAPEEDAFPRGGIELDAGGLQRHARIAPHARKPG